MLSELTMMEKAGVNSFKIEGRMKSEYYLATVINAYRRAMDGENLSSCEDELSCVAHRDYTKAYTLGNRTDTESHENGQTKGDAEYIGNVLGYENGYARIEMRNRFFVGDEMEILSPTAQFQKKWTVEEITLNGEQTDDAKIVQAEYKVRCPYPVQAGDIIRKRK